MTSFSPTKAAKNCLPHQVNGNDYGQHYGVWLGAVCAGIWDQDLAWKPKKGSCGWF